MANHSTVSNYRWVILLLLALMYLGTCINELALAPLLTHIIAELHISLGQAGSLLSVLALLTGIFVFAGSFFIDKVGLKITTILGLMTFGLGVSLSFLAHSYPAIFIDRVIVGIGYGICYPLYGVWVISWFPPKEQPFINTVINIVSYVGYFLAYMITVPVFELTGTWQKTMAVYGLYVIIVALLWAAFGKIKTGEAPVHEGQTAEEETNQIPEKSESGLKQAAKRKEVWLLTAMSIGVGLAVITFSTYLPMYFQQIRGLNAASASAMTGVLPIAGVIGVILCGVSMGALGLRKPIYMLLFLLMMLGIIGSVSIPSGPFLYLAIALIGLAGGGWNVIYLQIPMDLKEITEKELGGAFAIIIGISYILTYFVPRLFGLLEPKLGMATAMMVCGCAAMGISVISGLMLPETSPKMRGRSEVTEKG
jgi:predicted MFS family arabinose efflux permease